MKMTIKNRDGKIVFQTDFESCFPTSEVQSQMKRAGYKIIIKRGEKNNG